MERGAAERGPQKYVLCAEIALHESSCLEAWLKVVLALVLPTWRTQQKARCHNMNCSLCLKFRWLLSMDETGLE